MPAAISSQKKVAQRLVAAKALQGGNDNGRAGAVAGQCASNNQSLNDNDRSAQFDARARHAERTVSAPAMQMAESKAVGGVNASDALSDDNDDNDNDAND